LNAPMRSPCFFMTARIEGQRFGANQFV
jgi:hypothetical protein